MKVDLTSAALALLHGAGWTPAHKVDPTLMMHDLAKVGFKPSHVAFEFMQRFGNVRIEHDPSLVINDRLIRSSTDFDPIRVCTVRDAEVANLCSVLVGGQLFPIGVDSFHMTIYISEDETIYSGLDASVFGYADSVGDLFNNMSQGIRPRRLADWA